MKPHNEQVITLSSVLQSSIHADQKKIALNFKDIDIIDRVPLIYQNIDTLYLSSNKIKSLHGLYQFKKLTTLSLSYNLIEDVKQLHNIHTQFLQSLSLIGNPISMHPNYRIMVLELLSKLKVLDGKIITQTERDSVERIVKLRKTYLNMCYTLAQCCERLHRENSKLLMRVKLIQKRREMEVRDYDCSSLDIHTTQYTSWIKCVQCIPNPENGTQLKWTVARLIDTINRMFYRESFEDCMKIVVEKMGNEYESTMENLGRTIMDKIRKHYEKRQGYKISYLEQEKYFAIFPHDPLFIEILYNILKELAIELHKQEEYREELVESHADSLASDDTVALSDSKDTFFEKERVERRWNKMVIHHDNQKAELRKRIKQQAVLMYQNKLKRKVLDSFRQNKKSSMKRKVQAEAAKSLRAKVHYMKVVMRKVLRSWHEIADLRSRCRRAVRILRRVQKKSLERRVFIALESLRRHSRRSQSTEVARPRSAPSHHGRKTPEKKEINKGREESVHHQAKDSRKPEKQRARSTGRRGNFLMISATKLRDEATPHMIKQLKENIKKQRAWLKHLEQYENKVTSKK